MASEVVFMSDTEIEHENKVLRVTNCIMFVMYFILVAAATHNTIQFVIRGQRYKNFHVCYFYVLVYIIICMRVVWLSFILYQVNQGYKSSDQVPDDSTKATIFYLDTIATYLELLMGIQQASSMFELYLMIKSTALVYQFDRESTTLRQSRLSHGGSFLNLRQSHGSRLSSRDSMKSKLIAIQKQSAKSRWFFAVTSGLVIILMILAASIPGEKNISYQSTPLYNYLSLTCFALTAFFCVVILTKLVLIIQKNFSEELQAERMQLIVCQTIFVLSFILRTILISVVISTYWVDFTRDYPDEMSYTWALSIQFIAFNIIPYLVLIFLHWRNFREVKDPQEERIHTITESPSFLEYTTDELMQERQSQPNRFSTALGATLSQLQSKDQEQMIIKLALLDSNSVEPSSPKQSHPESQHESLNNSQGLFLTTEISNQGQLHQSNNQGGDGSSSTGDRRTINQNCNSYGFKQPRDSCQSSSKQTLEYPAVEIQSIEQVQAEKQDSLQSDIRKSMYRSCVSQSGLEISLDQSFVNQNQVDPVHKSQNEGSSTPD